MASQFAIEITFENAAACIISQQGASTGTAPSYTVSNVNFLPEILEFDPSYDAVFLQGLRQGGVPILFSSWHTFMFSTGGSSNVNLMIQERSRSVKALFTVMRRKPEQMQYDSHAMFFCTGTGGSAASMQSYQYRIGGRYYPPSPVQLAQTLGSSITNGGAEAYTELEKALNIVGDYRLSTACNTTKWALMPGTDGISPAGGTTTVLPELDYMSSLKGFNAGGQFRSVKVQNAGTTDGNCFAGNLASSCYVSAICLETSNGLEISGLNAEEQSDISFLANWSADQTTGFGLEVYSYFDSMIVLRENNVLELIQ